MRSPSAFSSAVNVWRISQDMFPARSMRRPDVRLKVPRAPGDPISGRDSRRHWETAHSGRSLRLQKTRSQQRLYRRKDVELLLKIRHLLYEERFTIEGARAQLRELGHDEGPPPPVPPPDIDVEMLKKLKQGLVELARMVED